MAEEIRYLQRELIKARRYLFRLEYKVFKTQQKLMGRTEEERIKRLEVELKRKYPDTKVDRELLSLVGTLPKIPRSMERQALAEAIAEKYGE